MAIWLDKPFLGVDLGSFPFKLLSALLHICLVRPLIKISRHDSDPVQPRYQPAHLAHTLP